ncbi:MAG TPA: response regulator [Chryseolinea sp.]|nr:response regulator [Chryseolinea sp.]
MKILVAHRQKQTVEAIRSVLSSVNPVVLHTESGLDGLLTSRIEHFDVIICGTDLPVVTGFEMVRSLRTNSINRETPVVFLIKKIDDRILSLGKALNAMAVLEEENLYSQLAPLIKDRVASRPDQVWEPLSTPIRSLYY